MTAPRKTRGIVRSIEVCDSVSYIAEPNARDTSTASVRGRDRGVHRLDVGV